MFIVVCLGQKRYQFSIYGVLRSVFLSKKTYWVPNLLFSISLLIALALSILIPGQKYSKPQDRLCARRLSVEHQRRLSIQIKEILDKKTAASSPMVVFNRRRSI